MAQRAAPHFATHAPRAVRQLGRDLRLLSHARAFAGADPSGHDCVYERSAYLIDAGRVLAARARVPYLVETDGILVSSVKAAYGSVLFRRAERLEQRKLRGADAVVVMSHASAPDIERRYEVPTDRMLVKGLGVEETLFDLPKRAPLVDVGFAGTFQPYHGVELLVAALELRLSLSGVLIGDGPTAAAVARRVGGGHEIELPGLLPRAITLQRLSECRVLVVPNSASTVYPVKLLEYAALGRPVVCPDVAAFDEFEEDGPALYRFTPGNAESLARALDAALDDAEGRAARFQETVRRSYTWKAAGERVAARMRELVAR